MDKPMKVCVLVGSMRKVSFNGMLAKCADLARPIYDETRHCRDRAIASL